MAKLFKEVGLPPTCYVQEVAYWLALGRAPDLFLNHDGQDERSDDESRETGETVSWFDIPYSPSELLLAGVSIDDFQRYEAGRMQVPPDDYLTEWEQKLLELAPAKEDAPAIVEWKTEFRAKILSDVEEARFAAAIDDQMVPYIDRARAEVFKALAAGDLKAQGWVRNAKDPQTEQPPYGDFVAIDARAWTLRHFNWEASRLKVGATSFEAVQVDCDDMLDVFPRPHCGNRALSVTAYPSLLIADEESEAVTSVAKPRGRSGKQFRSVRKVIRNFGVQRLKAKDAPTKREALIAEVQAFSEDMLEEKISRSTAQEYLSGLMPEIMPENDTP